MIYPLYSTGSASIPRSVPLGALQQNDFRPIALNGWGDAYNSYAHSMAWFQDHLYVGTARANLYLIRRRNPPPQWVFYPVNCPDDPFTLDLRAQIWRYAPHAATWQNVHTSPLVKDKDGNDIPREIMIRGMAVFQGRSDAAAALYVSTFSPTRGPGPMILRSEDGETFVPVSKPGFGYQGISAFRSLVAFQGKLYTSPIGSTHNRPNLSPYPLVFESADPARGDWRIVSLPGFGNPDNTAVFEMAAFNDHLYAATFNCVTGFEIWKTDGEGTPPYHWKQVMRRGAYRGQLNEGALSLCVFGNALYIGTGIQDGGYDRANRIGPAAGELICLYPDDAWDLIVGDVRLTPQGWKIPLSSQRPGFDNFFNGYIWRMCVHEGWLYVGTFDWSTFLPYSPVQKWPPQLRNPVKRLGIKDIVDREGGFDLWCTRDGVHWSPVTRTGFDNRYNCGARTIVSTPFGLFLGTANPFGPEIGVKTSKGWCYIPNSQGGLEIWLGTPKKSSKTDTTTITTDPSPRMGAPRPFRIPIQRLATTHLNQMYDKRMYDYLVNEYYDYSDFYNFGYWSNHTRTQREACEHLMEKLLAFIPKKAGTILDVACGKGATTRYLLEYYRPSDVVGINVSEKQLKQAQANAPDCTFLRMDATRLGFQDCSFDNVICVEAAFHFNTREVFLGEAYRVLKAGGRLVLSDILVSKWWEKRMPFRHEKNYIKDLDAYRAVCLQAGFHEVIVVDATNECWIGFYKHYACYLRQQLLTSEINFRTFSQHMRVVNGNFLGKRRYILVSAQKGTE